MTKPNSITHQHAPILEAPPSEMLLSSGDGRPFEVFNLEGDADIILICEHASNRIPAKLGDLGLTETQLSSHVAWDPGAFDLAKLLSSTLDAPLVAARFSRLVYDCNRPPGADSAMPANTEVCPIPGNESLTQVEKNARADEIYESFHGAVAGAIASRKSQGGSSIVVSIHSFTPVFNGNQRFVEIGYLFSRNDQLAKAMLVNSPTGRIHDVRLNEPYGPKDGVLRTIEMHTSGGEEPHVMIEVRNNLLADEAGVQEIHDLITEALLASLRQLQPSNKQEKPGSKQ